MTTQLARVTIEDKSGDNLGTVSLDIPAYTRTWKSFQDALDAILAAYYLGAIQEDASPSIGDFAFWLLKAAAQEPKEQTQQG